MSDWLDEIEARWKAATPQYWHYTKASLGAHTGTGTLRCTPEDCDAIRGAPANIACLVKEVRVLRAAMERLEERDAELRSEDGLYCSLCLAPR